MEKFYQTTISFIQKHKHLKTTIIFITKFFPIIPLIIYPIFLIQMIITNHPLLLQTIIKPLFALIFVSFIRKIINRSRPFEIYSIQPLITHKKGESFPSKHTLSSMIIALTIYHINAPLGIFLIVIGLLLSIGRVLVGVHFISDILCSIIISIVIDLI